MRDNTLTEKTLDRRQFFQRAALMGAVAVGAGGLLAGCKKKDGQAGGNKAAASGVDKAASGAKKAAKGAKKAAGLDCTDTSGLKKSEIKIRESLKYVGASTKPDQSCANCQQYEPPSSGGCGGCKVVPGPINPKGWCSSWVKKA